MQPEQFDSRLLVQLVRELLDLRSPEPQETPPVATADADGRAGACVLTTGRLRRGSLSVGAGAVAAAAQAAAAAQVRKIPSWPRSWADFRLCSRAPTGMHGPTWIFWPT